MRGESDGSAGASQIAARDAAVAGPGAWATCSSIFMSATTFALYAFRTFFWLSIYCRSGFTPFRANLRMVFRRGVGPSNVTQKPWRAVGQSGFRRKGNSSVNTFVRSWTIHLRLGTHNKRHTSNFPLIPVSPERRHPLAATRTDTIPITEDTTRSKRRSIYLEGRYLH